MLVAFIADFRLYIHRIRMVLIESGVEGAIKLISLLLSQGIWHQKKTGSLDPASAKYKCRFLTVSNANDSAN